nr:extracellular solute-binding protein [uncultured Schaedlerella sp.]
MKTKLWKRMTACLLTAAMVGMLAACGNGSSNDSNTQEANVDSDTGANTEDTGSDADAEAVELNLLSHRYAALEYYAQAMVDNAPDNVTLNTELTTYGDWQEKMTMNLSSKSSAYDLTYIFPPDLATFADGGWLLPLDEYIEKYKDEYHFDDIPDYLWDAYTYDGHIYGVPSHQWTALLFARDDVLKEAGLDAPETLDDLVAAAETLTTDSRSGLTLSLKASDLLAITFQCFMTACGGWWFDDDMKPAFNSAEAMEAVSYIQELMPYCPDGSTTYGSDEASLAMTQDLAAMGLIQTTRSGDMDNEEKSKVVGKVGFYNPPALKEGGPTASLFATAGYSISAFTENDPDLVFRTMCNALTEDVMKDGAETGMPVRTSLLNDELFETRPDYKAAWEAIEDGARMRPAIPEFSEIMEISMTALADVLINGTDAQSAMDKAAAECEEILDEAGYYD